ncbi:hypothetical protein E5K00_04930 [Hymenobacter aquaticus]|uniref:DUF4476 domain-containing protein n=1 Tax=Hymenobacter aquaticus TaxID=1867101 RepID=A0A4Z0Q3G4_9BACT|nr:hypothetical protein [Hymenobacter aquaticus]TGE24560.1 hypothetical protein E5K00_04930 [Hymenobacter aquaticus]
MKTLLHSCRAGLLTLALALGLGGPAAAQQRQTFTQQFAGSTVLLTSGDTLQGPLLLHRNEDVILLTMPDNTVNTFSAVAVQSFAVKGQQDDRRNYYDDFFDSRSGYYYGNPYYNMPPRPRRERRDTSLVRVFRTFRWNHDNDYSDFKSPAFFEQLSGGPNLLLRRESLIERPVYNNPMYGGYGYGMPRTMYYNEIRDAFYLGLPSGNVLSLRNPKKDLLAAFRQHAKQIEQYAKDNRLTFTEARDLAFIVNYANSLQKEPKP